MRCERILIVAAFAGLVGFIGCSSKAPRVCEPVAGFSSPAGQCVAMAEPEPPPPEPPEPPPPVVIREKAIELDRTIQFVTGSAELIEDSRNLLDDVVKVLEAHPEIVLIRLEGYTDSVGSKRKNLKLSTRRAKAVMSYLVSHGIEKRRLRAKGFGESDPVDDNGTEDGRFKNRRVDLIILKRDESKALPDSSESAPEATPTP